MAEWMAVVEPALNSVIPAIHGLLHISGMLLRHLPSALDLPGSEQVSDEPAWLAPGDPPGVASGLGHAGMFGPAEPDVIDIEVADAGMWRPEAGTGDPGGERTDGA